MVTQRLALGLLATAALVAVLGPVWEARQRAPEQTVRSYLAAVERGELEAALATLVPEAQAALRERIENQLGSRYRVEVVALATPSLLARVGGAPATTAEATILAEVTPVVGERWKSTSVVDLVERDGRWLLVDAPFT
ncbi:MAG: hypothetical protein H0V51_25160 [Chloroflexi bacterium]|nr:hypothetical protein [Chloroflexota bacterium]